MPPTVQISATPQQLAFAAAEQIIVTGQEAIAARGMFALCLAGGTTPRATYEALASDEFRRRLDWSRVEIFFGDERDVPPTHAESNFRMAREALLDRVAVPAQQVHPMRHENTSLRRDAALYAGLLRRRLPCSADGWPQMDLVLLGLGRDGHTASLFPATCILHERQLRVAAVYVPQQRGWRLSLTVPTLNHARKLVFLVSGREKAAALEAALATAPPKLLPVHLLAPDGEVLWLCDRQAASDLRQPEDP